MGRESTAAGDFARLMLGEARPQADSVQRHGAPSRRELSRALDLVPGYIRTLERQGMPTSSIDAALAWRIANIKGVAGRQQRLRALSESLRTRDLEAGAT